MGSLVLTALTVTNLNDSGTGSLRAAIVAANAAPIGTQSTIDFAVSGTVALQSDLPPIARSVVIDATTAPGHQTGGAPSVELNCNGNAGLVFAPGSDNSQLLGVALGDASGNGVTLDSSAITLAGNYIGLNLQGTAFGNGGDGIHVSATSANDIIGSNPTAASGVISNVVSGNAGNGIVLDGSSGNTLVNNYIGTDPTGTKAIANGGNGVWVTGASHGNTIGGTAFTDTATGAVNNPTGDKGSVPAVFVVPPLGNLVSGNGANGILIDNNSQNNVLNGNFVGTTADGDSALGNALDGVAINGANNNSLIGCQFVNNPFVYYNVLSANGGNGLHVTNSDNVTVQANFFGIGANNTTVIGNALNGILVDGSSKNTQVGGVIPLGNVSAGNGQNGIEVAGTASGFTTFNTFGGLLAFKGAAPNGNDGLLITSTGGGQLSRTNVFSGNANNGIEIGGNASGVTVDPDIVGLTTDGTGLLPNRGNGVVLDGTAHDNIIGGDLGSVIPENLFSGNDGYGLAILNQAHDNQVLNTWVGVDALGTVPDGTSPQSFGNQLGGILVGDTAMGNIIGGTAPGGEPVADVVSGNVGNGITLASSTSSTEITNDIIGFGSDGIKPVPNTGDSIATNASTNNTISNNLVFAGNSLEPFVFSGGGGLESFANASFGDQSVFYAGSGPLPDPATSGNGTLVINGSGSDITVPGGYSAIYDEVGNDTITGSGNLSIYLQGDLSIGTDFSTGSGADTIFAGGADTITGGLGNSSVITNGNNSVVGGSGSITVDDTSGNNLSFVGGSGAASVIGGAGNSTLFGSTGSSATFLAGGSGNSTLMGGSGTGASTIGGGNNVTAFASGTGPATLTAGTGSSLLNGTTGTGNELVSTNPLGNSGSALIGLNAAADTVVGGSGNSTIVGGAGPDTYAFLSGHAGGTATILGLADGDIIAFGGYENAEGGTANPIQTETVVDGSDQIKLTDGTTINLTGVNHTLFT
jgi:parallel beta-helix repeat protein